MSNELMAKTTPNSETEVLRNVLGKMGAYVYIKDTQSRYIYANEQTCGLFGLSADEVIGKDDTHFFSPESVEQIRKNDRSVLSSGQTEIRHITVTYKGTGETRSYIATKAPIYDDSGELVGLCGVSIDNTEQSRLENRLEASHLLLDTVLDNVEADIYMKDTDGRYLYVNQRVLNATHLTREQMLGHTDSELFPPEMAAAFKRIDDLVFASAHPQYAEEEMLEASGKKRYYWSTKLRVHSPDKSDFLIGFSTDITPLKEAEEALARSESRFRALFESSIEASILISKSNFIDCNNSALKLLGVQSKAEFLELTPGDLSPPFQPCGTSSAIKAAALIDEAFEQGSHKLEWIVKRRDNGEQIPVEAIVTAIDLVDGPALLVSLHDLTERIRHEEEIARLAYYDHLTKLPNRRLLYERLAQALIQHELMSNLVYALSEA